jgi:hypothetical protein
LRILLLLSGAIRPANAVVGEAVPILRAVDVAQVDQHRLLHRGPAALEIERAELLPFGDDDEGIGAVGAGIGAVAEFDPAELPPSAAANLRAMPRFLASFTAATVSTMRSGALPWWAITIVSLRSTASSGLGRCALASDAWSSHIRSFPAD